MKILLTLLRRVSLLSLLILCTYSTSYASHNVGCTITYTCLGGNQYEFTMTCYRDCNGINMPTSTSLSFTNNGSCGQASPPNLTLDTIGHLSAVDASQLCDPTTSSCQGGSQQGTQQWVYSGITTLPAGCIWTASFGTCCRSSAITNLQNSGSQGTYVSTTVNTNVVPCNNSVQFGNIPIIYTCDSTQTFYNHGATDPDGDTMVFSLTTPQDNPPANIPYTAGLSSTMPLQLVPGSGGFQFDSTTGQMIFTPADNTPQVAIVAMKVEEIRNGIVIATTIREVQIVVLTNCNNDPPAVDSNGVQGTAIAITGSSLELCRGNFASFQLVIQDPNGDSLTVTSNIINAIPGAVVAYNVDDSVVDSVIITFTVNSINLTPGIYPFTINVNDNACPVPSVQFLGYALKVYGANYTSNIYCRNDNDPVPIIIGDSVGVFLGLGTNPPGLVLDSITGIIDLDSSAVGTYDIVYTLDSISICPSDSITITIVDIPDPGFTYPQVLWCTQGTDPMPTITGTPGGTFSSDPQCAVHPFTGVIDISATSIGQHIIYYDVVGGTCASQDSFIIDVMELTSFAATSSQYFICPNVFDTIQLGVNVTYSGTNPPIQTYAWAPNQNINNINIANPQVILLTPNTYSVVYDDSLCPTQFDTIVITAPYPASINPTSDIVLCNGNAAQIGASVATGPGDRNFAIAGPVNIPMEDTTIVTLNVTGVAPVLINDALIASLSACFDININALGHITAILISPSGEQVVLTSNNGGLNTVLTNATFSSASGNAPITSLPFFPPSPANGFFFPQAGATGFNNLLGATTNGQWQLMVIHNNGGLSSGNGTLNNWCLNFQDLSASTFQWSPGPAGGIISCVQCDSPTVSPSTDTTFTVVATNLFGCTDTAYVNVVIDTALPTPILSCGAATTTSVTFHWIPVFGAAGYVASVNGGAPQNLGANTDSLQVTGLSTGQCVTLSIYPLSGNSCADGAPDSITCCAANCGVIDPLTITPNGPTTFCVGQDVTLTGPAGFNGYSWSTTATSTAITVNTTQLVGLTTTDINGCLDTGSIQITVVPGPTPTIVASGSTTLCAGESVVLDAGTFDGYIWNATGGNATTQTVTALASGSYIVTVNDAVGCIGVDSITVTVGSPLTVGIVGTNLSCNGVAPPDGSAIATPAGSFGSYTFVWTDNQTTATATGLPVGTHCVTVTDANSCTVSSCVTITEPSAVSVSTTQVNVTCFNGSDGSATANGAGGTGGYTFIWSPSGQTSSTATGLGAGVHCVTVTDATGCTVDTCITITQPAVTVTSNATVTSLFPNGSPISCGGSCDGEGTASGAGGTPFASGYLFTWDANAGNQTTAIATGLCVGPYSVTVTDSVGCSSISSITLTEPAPVTVTIISTTNPSCNGAADGSAEASGSGGAGGFTYQWDATAGNQTTAIATGLADGIYNVVATDANGCTGTVSVTLTEPSAVTVTSSISSNYNGASISCNGACDGELTAGASGGTGAHTYIWNDGQTNAIATALCAGTYSVTASDANGCSATSSITLTEPSAVTASSVSTDALCNGASDGTATASGFGGVGPYTFVWSTVPPQSTALATGLNAATGVYTATVSDANGCPATTSVTILEPSAVSATVASTPISCAGGSDGTATATPSGGTVTTGYTFLWDNFQTTNPATGLNAGPHSVTVTDNNGCVVVSTVTLTEPSAMSFTIGFTDASCNGYADGSASINVSGGVGGYTYAWSTNPQTTATATGLVAGIHCVTATDGNGCTVDTCIQVFEPAGFSVPTFSAIDVSCAGGSDGQLTVSVSGAIAPYTYNWSNGDNGITATGLSAGIHTVTISDANGCTTTGNAPITEPTPLQMTFDVDSVQCKNGSDGQIEAIVSGGTFPYTYLWNAQAGNQNTAIATGLSVGTYSVVATDFNGCTISGSATIFEPLTVLTASIINQSNPLCNGSCDGMIEVDAQGATPNYTYQWNNGQQTSIASGVCAGVHTVTVTDANGCSLSVGSVLTEPTAIALNPQVLSNYNGAAISCTGANDGSVGVTAAGGSGGYSYIWSPGGQNTANISNLVEGTYCVTVTDVSGCTSDTCITINDPVQLAATFTKVDILCKGDANGQILANATTGTGTLGVNGYEYKITGPNQTGNVFSGNNSWNNLAAGAYVVSVRDGNNCEIQLPIQITEPDSVLIDSVVVTDALCFGTATGTATAHASGGVGNFSYLWSDGQTTNPATGLAKGLYSVTVADANGCDRVEVFNVDEPTDLTGSITPGTIDCIGGTTTATAQGAGGTPIGLVSYLYNWDNGNTNATAINLAAGVHCVTITDDNACTEVVCVTITEPATGVSVIIAAQTDALCQGTATGTATAQGVGGTAGYTYLWQTAPAQNAATATGLAAGVYTVVVTDDNGCTNQTTVTISEPTAVSATIMGVTNATCNGVGNGSATVAGNGGTPGYTYLWSDANAQTDATATGLVGGAYTVTVTDANGCMTTVATNVTEPTAVNIVQINTTNVLCTGDATGGASISVNGGTPTNGYTYNWSGTTQTSIVVSGLSAGQHTVTVTDFNGCFDIDTFVIAEPAQALTGYTTTTPALCNGAASGEIGAVVQGGTGTGTYTYVWNTTPTQFTVVADSIPAGNYTVTVTDANGCTVELSGVVTEATPLAVTAAVQQDVTCYAGSDGSATASFATGGTPNYNYVWTDPTGQSGQIATGLSAGVVSVVVTDANGCSATASVTIGEDTEITLNENITNVSCFGGNDGSINIISSNKTIVNYSWGSAGIGNPLSNLIAGTYNLTVTDSKGCQKDFTYDVLEPTELLVTTAQTVDILCYNDDNARLEATATGGTPNYGYSWSTGANAGTANNVAPGVHTVTATDSKGCTATATITVNEPEELLISGTTTGTLCAGDATGAISAFGSGGTITSGLLQYSIDGATWQAGNIFPGLLPGIYTLSVQDQNGCMVDTMLVVQDADPFFIVSMTPDTTIEYLDSLTIHAEVNDTTGVTYSWDQISGTIQAITDSSWSFGIAPDEEVHYLFTATNGNGCSVDSIVIVEVEKPRRANAATAFTPNGDGVNDYFFIQGGDKVQEVTTLRVYDRWGELVFDGKNLDVNVAEQGWDGNFRFKPSTSGSYIWYSEVLFKDGHTETLKGDVILLR